jgi:hypothetical protein
MVREGNDAVAHRRGQLRRGAALEFVDNVLPGVGDDDGVSDVKRRRTKNTRV